jgi:hypothetical protein
VNTFNGLEGDDLIKGLNFIKSAEKYDNTFFKRMNESCITQKNKRHRSTNDPNLQ